MSGAPDAGRPNGPATVPETRAKQGRKGVHVLVVLVTSLALAVIAALVLGLI